VCAKEVNHLKAKAIREQREVEEAKRIPHPSPTRGTNIGTGVKRSFASMSSPQGPATLRDGRTGAVHTNRPLDSIRPARNFAKYVEYDFSKMTDTKGGFLTEDDDPYNKALYVRDGKKEQKPAHITQKEWDRHQLLKSTRRDDIMVSGSKQNTCCECGSLEIDRKWEEAFGCCVCSSCKEKYPEKYSLLTKTEAKEDYLLTDPELKDEELLPRLEKPNPHKATWNNMMLFLRYQVEEYAFSSKKWGSPEALDAEFVKRESEKKRRREAKFRSKLQDLKKRTRVEAYRRNRNGPAGGNFGDDLGSGSRHVHQWGRAQENPETGMDIKKCIDCGMEVEELEF